VTTLPIFPPGVLEASKNNKLIVFLGAGISCAAGLPDWNNVKNNLITRLRENKLCEESVLQQYTRMDFYECFELIRSTNVKIYQETIDKSVELNDQVKIENYKNWIKIIKSWKPIAIVSTNVDELLLNYSGCSKDDFRTKDNCAPQDLKSNKVFLIHGVGKESIWTLNIRDTLYGNRNFENFLWNVFGSYTVLFMGTSFREKWREYVKLNPALQGQKRYFHYALLPSAPEYISDLELEQFSGVHAIKYDNSDGVHINFAATIENWNLSKPRLNEDDITKAGTPK